MLVILSARTNALVLFNLADKISSMIGLPISLILLEFSCDSFAATLTSV